MADRGIDRLVGPEGWQAMVRRMGDASADGRLEDGLTRALEEVSAALVAHFPQPEGANGERSVNPNQLPDEPVLR